MSKDNEEKPIAATEIYRKPRLTMGERFKDARTVHNQHGKQTTGAVEKATGISKSTISETENDKRAPGAETISELARHYGVSADYLLGLSDVITPDTTAQAVIAYTGLSEANVLTLHHAKENSNDPMFSNTTCDEVINFNISRPYLDCLNDLLDAIYSKKKTIIRDYTLIRHYADWINHYDPQYFSEDREMDLQAHGHTSVPISAFIEQKSIKIAREIENYLIGKYTAMDGDDE